MLWNTNLKEKCKEFQEKNKIQSKMMSYICNAITSGFDEKEVRMVEIKNIRDQLALRN